MKDLIFPKNFEWGVATSAFQIEGARAERGDSVWDDFCTKSHTIKDGSDGTVACDHYNRYREDVAIMKSLEVDCYRFSISWSRVLPEGTGKINPKGIEFYNHVIDECLKYQIEPIVTMLHFDMPARLDESGSWSVPCA